MAGVIKIEITESTEELKRQLNLPENSEVKERLQVLYWLKTKQVQTKVRDRELNRKTSNHGIEVAK
jgi:hypothetical protein